jgi:sialic acid synthase SpsE
MYALIYDEHDLLKPHKKVVSVHRTRQTAEKALEKRKRILGRTVEECHTRIVWVDRKIARGDVLKEPDFVTWRPGEEIPEGELYSDSD